MYRIIFLLVSGIFCLSSPVYRGNHTKELKEDRLTSENYDKFLNSSSHLIMFYYLEGVRSLSSYARMYSRVKNKIQKKWPEKDFRFGYINSTKDMDLMVDLEIDDFPLVQVVIHDIPVIYLSPDGSMSCDELPDFVSAVLSHKCQFLTRLDAGGKSEDYEVFYFNEDRPHLDTIMNIICFKYSKTARIFKVSTQELMGKIAKEAGFELEVEDFGMVAKRKHDEQSFLFEKGPFSDDIMQFIFSTNHPLSIYVTESTYKWAVQQKLVLLMFFYQQIEGEEDKIETLKNAVFKLYDTKVVLGLADMNQDFVNEFIRTHGIEESMCSLFIVKPFLPNVPKYKYEEDSFTEKSISKFWSSFKFKSLKRFYKSEKVYEERENWPVTVAFAYSRT